MYGSTNLNELNDESTLDAVVRLIGNPASGELYLSDIRSKAAVSLERYGRYLAERFREHCITVPPAVNLQAGLGGEVRVVGDHPERAVVERLFKNNQKLIKGFKELEVVHEIIRTQEEAMLNQQLRQRNPGAVEQLDAGAGVPVFNLGITSGGALAFFSQASN